jgi:transcriptional regulator with XRE-family HTH domain
MTRIRTTNTFGAWLQKTMTKHNISVYILAKTIGIDKRYITHWIQGTAHPRLQNTVFLVISLERLTNISRLDLLDEICQAVLNDS